jgi:hypothetical protein
MVAMRMVQVAIDQIIDMVAVRHSFVTATGTVNVARFVAAADMRRSAAIRVGRIDGDHMLIDMVTVNVMQVAIVQIVHMPIVLNRGVAAIFAVLMRMVSVLFTGFHFISPVQVQIRRFVFSIIIEGIASNLRPESISHLQPEG